MPENLSHDQIRVIISRLNQSLNVSVNPEDFRSISYSSSSLADLLVQKITDELKGEWTSDMAFHKLQLAISTVTGIDKNNITQESLLDSLFPASNRKSQVKKLEEAMGFPMDILKPNSIIYGLCIFLFFACIPFGIGMDWFFSGITMAVLAIIIFILGKTGNTFRMKTVIHLADHIAWKNYLRQKRGTSSMSDEEIRQKVNEALS